MLSVGLVGSAMALVPDSPSDDFAVSSATYLGGSGADQATAVDVAPDWSVVFGGTMPSHNPGGVTPVELLGGGDGVVIRLSHDGTHVQSITRIGQQVNDLEINDEGAIAVCGDFGVALLSADAQSITWNDDSGSASRCAIAQGGADSANGTVAAIIDGNAHVYGAQGNALGTWEIGGNSQSDIAVDAATQSVIATGYNQVSSDLQVASLKAWSYDGATLKWTSYNFSASEVTGENLGADTRGERVAIGRDGKVYFAGTINGGTGASIFARDPKDITSSAGDRTVTTDNYNTPTNVGSIKMTWYGRYAPDTGDLELGQSLLTRLSSGKGNSIAPNALMADAQGRLYIGGSAYASIERRGQLPRAKAPGLVLAPPPVGGAAQ
jgi:hypothetical protein